MQRTAIAIGVFAACALTVARAQDAAGRPVPPGATETITRTTARAHIEALASDAMLGRNTPSPELDSAARYIAAAFRASGAEPVAGSYLQRYNLKQRDLGKENSLIINGRAIELRNGFNPYEFSSSGTVDAGAVFAGYGISRPDSGYDDYAGIDARGKVVVIVTGEPAPRGGMDRGSRSAIETNTDEKMRMASAHGAVGVLVLSNPLQSRFLRPGGYPWRAYYQRNGSSGVNPYQLDLPSTAAAIPSAGISGEAAKELFGRPIEAIAAMVRRIDSTGRPMSMELGGRVMMRIDITETLTPVNNVVAMVPGRSRPDEFVVIGAHYDHIGHYAGSGTGERKTADTIFNGADDNASGTTGLLLAARAFGSLAKEDRPARSILFIAFSGEEKGLYGSRAYVAAPLVPLENTVAMLNMDMIGRNSPDSVSVAGHTRSRDLAEIAETANRAEPITLAYDLEEMFYRSDQASFAMKHIPVLFFSSGLHRDYHQASDSPEKIDNDKLAHIARLCFRTAWMIADSPSRPRYTEPVETTGEPTD